MSISVLSDNLNILLQNSKFISDLSLRLKDFIPTKRWYSAKDSVLKSISIENTFILQNDFAFVILKTYLSDNLNPMFVLPLGISFSEENNIDSVDVIANITFDDKVGIIYDASGATNFSEKLFQFLEQDMTINLSNKSKLISYTTSYGKKLLNLVRGLPQKKMGVEQSNTSLIVGKKVMLKVYRRIEYGENPEITTSSFLTENAHFENIPAYLGKIEVELENGKKLALAILQEFVQNEGDGWNYTLSYLKNVYENNLTDHANYLKLAYLLGVRTAEMHKAFSTGTDKIFSPVKISTKDLQDWKSQVLNQAEKTIAVAKEHITNLSGEVKTQVEKLIRSMNIIEKQVNKLLPQDISCFKTRYHGDYHLGQVVISNNDFYLLDFEGEPLKPINERQNTHCVLKDVAGMVRSFDYAAFGSLYMYVSKEQIKEKYLLAKKWQQETTDAYLDGYFKTIFGVKSVPNDSKIANDLLNLFILEKALYEVIYEVANRPDWVSIPMNGLTRLINFDGE